WRVLPDLTLNQAVRFDHLQLGRSGSFPAGFPFSNGQWDRAIDEVSFNSGAVWRVAADDALRLTAARGLQLPSLLEFGGFLVGPTTGFAFSGNANIQPSAVTNYELGWEHDIRAVQAHTKVAAFYQTTDDIQNVFSGSFVFSPTFFAPIIL